MKKDNPFKVRKNPSAAGAILACDKMLEISQVFIVGNYRYTIIDQLSDKEFEKILEANKDRDGVQGTVQTQSSVGMKETFQNTGRPTEAQKFHYLCRVELLDGHPDRTN